MFSENIQSLIGSSNATSAAERVTQLEAMLARYSVAAQPSSLPKPDEVKAPSFSEYMKMKPAGEVKYKIVPPTAAYSRDYINNLISDTAKKYSVDEKLIHAIVKQESGYNTNATSAAGARGLMQLMPQTAKSFGVSNPYNPASNLDAGVKLISGLIKKYNGNVVLALSAYNSGSGNVSKFGGVPPFKETQNYVRKILSDYLS